MDAGREPCVVNKKEAVLAHVVRSPSTLVTLSLCHFAAFVTVAASFSCSVARLCILALPCMCCICHFVAPSLLREEVCQCLALHLSVSVAGFQQERLIRDGAAFQVSENSAYMDRQICLGSLWCYLLVFKLVHPHSLMLPLRKGCGVCACEQLPATLLMEHEPVFTWQFLMV